MDELIDIAIIGGGPAGMSAALNAHVRNKSVKIFTGKHKDSGLFKAESVDNYLGMPDVPGDVFLETCRKHIEERGIQAVVGRVLSIMPMGTQFYISSGPEVYSARAIILASGVVMQTAYPGEQELLGRGVSYCATCDGMLYRNKKVVVVAKNDEAGHEANFLNEIGCSVTVISDGREFDELSADIQVVSGKKLEIYGDDKVEGISIDGEQLDCQGVFILRKSIAISTLMPSIELIGGHISVDRSMAASVPGVYAAGDCTGRPYQVAKAVGEGQMAALSAVEYLDNLK